MTDHELYFRYLQRRSLLGLLYRRHVAYPRLSRHLTGRALDIGCGLGDMLDFRANSVGVDINPLSVEWCRQRGHEAHLMKPDELPFEPDSFLSVLLDNVLEHLAEPRPLLAEIRRVLTQDGTLIIVVPGSKGYQADPDHKVNYDRALLNRTLQAGGFKALSTFDLPFHSDLLNKYMKQYCLCGTFLKA